MLDKVIIGNVNITKIIANFSSNVVMRDSEIPGQNVLVC